VPRLVKIFSSTANGAFLKHSANTSGLHHLAVFMLVVAFLLLAMTALDRLATPGRLASPGSPPAA
jgi:hypothetical protein